MQNNHKIDEIDMQNTNARHTTSTQKYISKSIVIL